MLSTHMRCLLERFIGSSLLILYDADTPPTPNLPKVKVRMIDFAHRASPPPQLDWHWPHPCRHQPLGAPEAAGAVHSSHCTLAFVRFCVTRTSPHSGAASIAPSNSAETRCSDEGYLKGLETLNKACHAVSLSRAPHFRPATFRTDVDAPARGYPQAPPPPINGSVVGGIPYGSAGTGGDRVGSEGGAAAGSLGKLTSSAHAIRSPKELALRYSKVLTPRYSSEHGLAAGSARTSGRSARACSSANSPIG